MGTLTHSYPQALSHSHTHHIHSFIFGLSLGSQVSPSPPTKQTAEPGSMAAAGQWEESSKEGDGS